jgi:glycosyltransferase involved in cell wall biosynthesis
MNIYIVIPTFNEERHIKNVLKDVAKHKLPIIVVNDGSTDATADILSPSTIHNSQIITLTHRVNLGKGAAMKTGAEAAFSRGADAVVFMDSDGQHKASDLPKFIKALESGKYGIIFGSRVLSHGVPLVRFLGNKFASILISVLFGIYVSDLICGYRAITRISYEKIKWESAGYAVETEMAIKTAKYGIKYCEVPVETVYLDNVKGVTILDAFNIFANVIAWRIKI